MSLHPPFLLVDRYEVEAEIGRGGHSVVFRARDRVLARDVAVKLLRDDAMSDHMLARFRQEMQVTAQLEHAHILHVYDTGMHAGLPFIVMELAPGRTLSDRLEQERQLPVADALLIAREVGLALSHAHERGIVHRDVKPDNILLGPGGALLGDFGVARVSDAGFAQRITSTGTAVGTLLYMSPEQLCAEPVIDARSDQYALACVLYEMLAGIRPHVSSSFEALRMLRMTSRHAPVRMHRPAVSPSVERAIDIALSATSADRFRDMREFLQAIGAGTSTDFSVSSAGQEAQGTASPSGETRQGQGMLRSIRSRQRGLGRARAAAFGTVATMAAAGALFLFQGYGNGRSANESPRLVDQEVVVSIGDVTTRTGTDAQSWLVTNALRAELDAWAGVRATGLADGAQGSHLVIQPTLAVVNDSARLQFRILRTPHGVPRMVERLVAVDRLQSIAPTVHDMMIDALVHLIDSTLTPTDVPGVTGLPERSLDRLRRYIHGIAAIRAGTFELAFRRLDSVAKQAPRFKQASFWAAQAGAWTSPNDPQAWREHASIAVRLGSANAMDSLLAMALDALSRADFPGACTAYRQATHEDPSSYLAWFGLGECQRLDGLIEPTSRGPRFRSSHWSALRAYARAAELAPTSEWLGAMLPMMMRMTYAEGSRSRRGTSSVNGPITHSALVSLVQDTLAFFPLESQVYETSPIPISWASATRRAQAIARDLTARAIKRWPDSPSVWLHRALALELSGLVTPSIDGEDAGSALDRARVGVTSAGPLAQIAVARVRIALRRGDFEEASRLARAALATPRSADPVVRTTLAPLAALLGDIPRALMLALPDQEHDATVPIALADSVAEFALRAESGACEGLEARRLRLEALFVRQLARPEVAVQRRRLLADPYLAAIPCLGVSLSREFDTPLLLHRAYRQLAARDLPHARRLLDSLQLIRSRVPQSSITWDARYAAAWASAQAGDTAGARAQLEDALNDIANMSRFTLDRVAQAAGLRRGIALLATLSPGDTRWVQAAKELHPVR